MLIRTILKNKYMDLRINMIFFKAAWPIFLVRLTCPNTLRMMTLI